MLSIKPRQRAGKKGGIFSTQHNSPEVFQSYFGEKIEKRREIYTSQNFFKVCNCLI